MELMGRKMRARASSLSECTAQDGPSHTMALSHKLRKLKVFFFWGKSPLFSFAQDSYSILRPHWNEHCFAQHQPLCMHHVLKSWKVIIFPRLCDLLA